MLTQLRQRGETPVIMLTALDQDLDKLTALRMGADDYVVKPFNPSRGSARVRAVLRRTLRASRVDAPTALRVGPLLIDSATHAVHVEAKATVTKCCSRSPSSSCCTAWRWHRPASSAAAS